MRSELGENWKHEEREGNFRGSFLDKGGAAREGVWGKKGRNWGGGSSGGSLERIGAVWGVFSSFLEERGKERSTAKGGRGFI